MDRRLPPACDLLVVGGGINGVGIARDAVGRGLSVVLVERDDLAGHTSSASTKLIHGGLRYLEYYELRLVREALIERERLLAVAPHIIWPLEFVLPVTRSSRPGWMIRAGLFLYDHIGGRKRLPAARSVRLNDGGGYGAPLTSGVAKGFVYSDCWVDDARLVALNAVDAAARGATILTRTAFLGARREADGWTVRLSGDREITAGTLVNAAGPWVGQTLDGIAGIAPERPPRLVKGSHIVVPRLYDGDHCYILQNDDRRIIFAIPYEQDFTLIGTTDVDWTGEPGRPAITPRETAYLCDAVNRYFTRRIAPADVVHSFSGVRPLYDDGASEAAQVTRDYVLQLGANHGPQLLSVFGGKITTYRRLAEHALEKLAPFLPPMTGPWTAGVALPGGDMAGEDFGRFLADLRRRYPFLSEPLSHRLARAYGTAARMILSGATGLDDLGEDLGGGLYAREVDHLVLNEFARTPEDILWRRSKLGLHLDAGAADRLAAYLARRNTHG